MDQDDYKELVDFLGGKFDKIDTRFGQIDARFGQIDARFGQIDARFGQIDARFEQMDARFEQMDQRFDKMDQRFEQIDARFEQMDQRFDKMDQRFDKMDQRFETLEETVRGHGVLLEKNNELILTVSENTLTANRRLDRFQKEVREEFAAVRGEMSAGFDAVHERVDRLEQTLERASPARRR